MLLKGFSMMKGIPAFRAASYVRSAHLAWALPTLMRSASLAETPERPHNCDEERSGGGSPGFPVVLRRARLHEAQTTPSQMSLARRCLITSDNQPRQGCFITSSRTSSANSKLRASNPAAAKAEAIRLDPAISSTMSPREAAPRQGCSRPGSILPRAAPAGGQPPGSSPPPFRAPEISLKAASELDCCRQGGAPPVPTRRGRKRASPPASR